MKRWTVALAIGAVALGTVPGCSLVFVDGPPAEHASVPFFDCTSSNFAPGADTVLAGVMGLAVIGGASEDSNDREGLAVTAGVAATAAVSAVLGYRKVARCREAKERLAARMMDRERARMMAPPPPGWVPPRDPWLAEGPPPGGSWQPPPTPPSPTPPAASGAAARTPAPASDGGAAPAPDAAGAKR